MKLKSLLFLPLVVFMLSSCSTVRVATDYDTKANFKQYKTFAFYKKGIDKAPISDLDKKRIMRAIERELLAKGMTKSSNPDILVSLFTKSRKKVNVYDNLYWGYGYQWRYNSWMWGGASRLNINQYTEGTLFVDLIDAKKRELVWQGIGSGALSRSSTKKRVERINEFVKEIMNKYPPDEKK